MKTKIITTAALAALLIWSVAFMAQAQFNYTTNNDTITITRYTGPDVAVTFPDTIDGLPVTSIGAGAFAGCTSLTSVTIPNSVTNIRDGPFADCTSLMAITVDPLNSYYTSVGGVLFNKNQTEIIQCPGAKAGSYTIPNSVTSIGDYAFSSCASLTSVAIPNSVTSIGDGAFFFCESLTSVSIGNGVTSIGDSAFHGCSSLTSVSILNSVTRIGDSAFYGCTSLTSVSIGNGVTAIGDRAFSNCDSLTDVTIPNSVTAIGACAFDECWSLKAVYFQGNAPTLGRECLFCHLDPYMGEYCGTGAIVYYPANTVGWGPRFGGAEALPWNPATQFAYAVNGSTIDLVQYQGPGGVVIIPDTIDGLPVTSIGDSAFYGCTNLTSVSVPNSVTSIGAAAFAHCTSLISIALPNNVTSLGDNAFRGCSSLTSITIPNSVTFMGNGVFAYCSSLRGVSIPNSVADIGESVFSDCSSLTSVTISDSVISIKAWAFYECMSLTNITIPDSVISIGDWAFTSCGNLTGVYFLGNAPSSGESVFALDANATVYYLPGTTGWGPTWDERPTMPWNPQIRSSDSSFGVGTNGFGFTITGTANIPIMVEASTDLSSGTYVALRSCTLTNGSLYFSDPLWTNYLTRFYRIRSP